MSRQFNDRFVSSVADNARAHVDQGLRQYMLGIYNYMTLGIAITGFMAYLVSSTPALVHALATPPLSFVVMFAPLGFVLFLSARIMHLQTSTAKALFFAYAAFMGLSLSFIFLAYTGTSVVRVFFISASTFAAMSLYGYTTKKDLTSLGSFFMMGLIGLVIASVVNIFMQSSALDFAISLIGVGVFTGLTAFDTQNIKYTYHQMADNGTRDRMAILGALRLYLDFINLFLSLLRLMGDRR